MEVEEEVEGRGGDPAASFIVHCGALESRQKAQWPSWSLLADVATRNTVPREQHKGTKTKGKKYQTYYNQDLVMRYTI
ncbi:hypothetical protein E2C01_055892 [Portunus trituberculatus]|uniref:Uncharacterized protein n=1 Tax=Portunus trituberculatus TaxID=210409 RepID=A0A5B7GWS5_PORTR|nr:hypothetical protein [Portunus trituberculatus]